MATTVVKIPAWAGLATGLLALFSADVAAAQECASDGDCGPGFVCRTEQYTECSACRDEDEMCESECELVDYSYCAPKPCDGDADCPDTSRCHSETYVVCAGSSGGCAMGDGEAGCGGSIDEEPECREVTSEPTCRPRYQLPCLSAGDCGPGFACEEEVYYVCSGMGVGGSGAAGGSAGAAADAGSDTVSECHEEPSATFACHLLEVGCESSSECAAGLVCQNNPYAWTCDGGGSVGGAGGESGGGGIGGMVALDAGVAASAGTTGSAGSVSTDEDAGVDGPVMDCVPSEAPAKVCAPEGFYGDPTGPGGEGGRGGGSADAGVIDEPDQGGQGGNGGNTGSAGLGGPTSGGDGDDDNESEEGGQHGQLPRFGCSVGGADAGSQLSNWFSLIGLIAFGLRRRARRSA